MTGLAGRITVNAALLGDPSKLTVYNTSPVTPSGDTTRADFIYSQLTSGSFTYSPKTGLGSAATPFKGTIAELHAAVPQPAEQRRRRPRRNCSRARTSSSPRLQQKFNSTSGVNIDTEMANLIALQNSYAANAHVMCVVQSMMNNAAAGSG